MNDDGCDASSSASGSARMRKSQLGALLRRWRNVRRLSQLDLALDADISMRHLSCLETGRAQASREMVLRLAEALQIPLRERNAFLIAAGYAPLYRQTHLDALEMEAARSAVDFLIGQQEPYPALVVDRYWNILRMNAGTKRFLKLFPGCDPAARGNGVRLIFHPHGLRPFIENWEHVAARLIQRVHREILANPLDEKMKVFLDELLSYPAVPSRWRSLEFDGYPPPFFTIDYRWNDCTLRLFSTITSFGTSQDIELHELRIESFFPADQVTRATLTAI
jgi:transcriptional regulator with XRE-family HTH domain